MIPIAPFETFTDYRIRATSENPYDDAFINRCREKALEYDGRCGGLLSDLLKNCVPPQFRGKVFNGIRAG